MLQYIIYVVEFISVVLPGIILGWFIGRFGQGQAGYDLMDRILCENYWRGTKMAIRWMYYDTKDFLKRIKW